MTKEDLINQRATTCRHGGHCEWIACDKCSHYEPDVLNQQPCEDCRNCKEWNRCPCGKEGHEKGTSIGYSIGECKNYEPCDDCISRQAVLALPTSKTKTLSGEIIEEEVNIELIKALPSVVPKEKTVIETLEKIKKEIKQIRIHCGYLDVQGVTIIEVLEIIDKHLSEVSE